MVFTNYYEILGVPSTATNEEIKQAYRKLSAKFHPDTNNGDAFLQEMFKKLNEANETLSNPKKRKEYDYTLGNLNDSFAKLSHVNSNSGEYREIREGVTRIFDQIKLYFEKEQVTTDKYAAFLDAQDIPKPKYLTPTSVLWTLLAMLAIYLIFKPASFESGSYKHQQVNSASYEWVTIENADVYLKPNIRSSIIGTVPSGTGFNSLKETNYFVKVTFVNKQMNDQIGYIRKRQLKKNPTNK